MPRIVVVSKPRLDLKIDVSASRPWSGIVWHHSASPDKKTRDWDGIVKYHTSHRIDFNIVDKDTFERRLKQGDGKVFEKPWKDVGYHGGTELVKGEPIFHWGRPLSMVGAHAGVVGVSNKFNEIYLGLCCIGNFDLAPPAPELWDFNLRLTRSLMDAFHIPFNEVIGHRGVFDRLGVPRQKTCPGTAWDMEKFQKAL